MTAPISSEPVAGKLDRPAAPVAAAVVVVASFLAGAGAVAASSVMGSDLARLGIAVVLVVVGWLVMRPGPDHALSVAIGRQVLRGVGTSTVVLGAYLGGLAALTTAIPDGPGVLAWSQPPSATTVIVTVYGIPTLALLALAVTGMRAWSAGAGIALPMVAVLIMATTGAGTAVISVTMLVVAAVLAVVVLRVSGPWADLASAAAAMAASFAFGAGTSPFGTLGSTQLAGTPESAPAGRLSAGALVAVLAGALLVAAALLLIAVARRDLATGVLAGSIFAMPPVLLAAWLPPGSRWPAEVVVALAGVPVLVALAGMVAIRVPRLRDRVVAALPKRHDEPRTLSSAMAAAACAVVVAAAAVAFVILAVPVIGMAPWLQGAIALVVLFAAAALGYWLPATPGAAASVVALLGLGLASPWARLLAGSWVTASIADRVIVGVLDLGAAAALAWFLTRRHNHPGVYAAATYTLAGSLAAFLGALLFDTGAFANGDSPFANDLAPVAILGLPLLLLGLGALVAVVRGHRAVGHAVGAVAFAVAGLVPIKVTVGLFTGGGVEGYAMQYALSPLTPTDWLQTSAAFRDANGTLVVAVLVLVVVALAVATSLPLRPSAPLAGAVALLVLAGVQSAMLIVLSNRTSDDAQLLGQVLGGLALVVAVVAAAVARVATARVAADRA